jgi:hypothetical protein
MWGMNSTHDLTYLKDHAAAAAYYEKTKPIRGRDKDRVGVPLHVNRKDWQTYSLRENYGAYEIWLYDTPILTFLSDNTMKVQTYPSRTTAKILNRYLPSGVSVSGTCDLLGIRSDSLPQDQWQRVMQEEGPDRYLWLPVKHGIPVHLVREWGRMRILSGAHHAVVRRLDRTRSKEAKAQRDRLAPFLDFHRVATSFLSPRDREAWAKEVLKDVTWWTVTQMVQSIEMAETPEEWQLLAAVVEQTGGVEHYKQEMYVRLYREQELYTPVTLPIGKLADGWKVGSEINWQASN